MSEIDIPAPLGERVTESSALSLHELHSPQAAGDPLLARFESLVEAVLLLPPPSVPCSHPQWVALFRWCGRHRKQLAAHARDCIRNDSQERVDVWLRELGSPPKGLWYGVRHGVMPYIRLVGLAPRGQDQPMFTGGPQVKSPYNGERLLAPDRKPPPEPSGLVRLGGEFDGIAMP